MKRKLLFGASFLFIAWAATSCKSLTDCQTCKIVTRKISDNSEVSSNGGTEYCGADLVAFKAANPTITNTVTDRVTKVECN
jgi:hypothetical protein